MLSLYLAVRPPPASLSLLADRADEFIAEAEAERRGRRPRRPAEMVTRALEDRAQIWVIRGAHSPVVARLYTPVLAAV